MNPVVSSVFVLFGSAFVGRSVKLNVKSIQPWHGHSEGDSVLVDGHKDEYNGKVGIIDEIEGFKRKRGGIVANVHLPVRTLLPPEIVSGNAGLLYTGKAGGLENLKPDEHVRFTSHKNGVTNSRDNGKHIPTENITFSPDRNKFLVFSHTAGGTVELAHENLAVYEHKQIPVDNLIAQKGKGHVNQSFKPWERDQREGEYVHETIRWTNI